MHHAMMQFVQGQCAVTLCISFGHCHCFVFASWFFLFLPEWMNYDWHCHHFCHTHSCCCKVPGSNIWMTWPAWNFCGPNRSKIMGGSSDHTFHMHQKWPALKPGPKFVTIEASPVGSERGSDWPLVRKNVTSDNSPQCLFNMLVQF